jgi:putative tricarboxylic transport membrane protein
MTLNRDAVAALVLLAVFLGFGYEATLIELFPGQETEVFSPRTMPLALAVGGTLMCLARLVQCLRHAEPGQVALGGFDWFRASLLCVTMIGYGLLFEPLGFLLATAVFLGAGFLVLGERRIVMLILLPLVFAALFWLVMTRMLGLYLAPGILGI